MNHTVKKSSVTLVAGVPFDFEQTVTAHGWMRLLPYSWDNENKYLQRIQQISSGQVVHLQIKGNQSKENPEIHITILSSSTIYKNDELEVEKIVSHMLRLDEDFSGLYKTALKTGGHYLNMTQGFGRLLRSPTVFEDVVKTICTTNIQWAGTKRMVKEIVDAFGNSFNADPIQKSFPSAKDITGYRFNEFIDITNLGYRAEYIYELAQRISNGDLDIESFTDGHISTADLRKKLLSIKGIGNYAAATLLMLLGHYDALPVDSVFREFVFKKYFKGKVVTQKKAEDIYRSWGHWKYLAYWYDMTSKQ